MSFRVANFMRFRDGKLVENLSVIDSFDGVEQVLGHPLAPGAATAAIRSLFNVHFPTTSVCCRGARGMVFSRACKGDLPCAVLSPLSSAVC
jgi:hypothetical protein